MPFQDRPPSRGVEYPGLRELLNASDDDLAAMAVALDHLAIHAYGTHNPLTAEARKDRLTLHKLANMVRQLHMVYDMPLYELCIQCPEQLLIYLRTLDRSLPLAHTNGLRSEHAAHVERVKVHLCGIHRAVTSLRGGLS